MMKETGGGTMKGMNMTKDQGKGTTMGDQINDAERAQATQHKRFCRHWTQETDSNKFQKPATTGRDAVIEGDGTASS